MSTEPERREGDTRTDWSGPHASGISSIDAHADPVATPVEDGTEDPLFSDDDRPAPARVAPDALPGSDDSAREAAAASPDLLDTRDRDVMSGRWRDIQAAFVDEPQRAVHEADDLVAGLMEHLSEVFASERRQLESQWSRGEDVSTEDLRVSLQRYRSFFERLLSV